MQNSCTWEGPSFCHLEDGSCPQGWGQLSPALGMAPRLVRAPHNKSSALPPSYLSSPCPLLLCARQVNPANGSVIYRCWRNDFWILRFRRQKTNLLKTNLFILLLNFSVNADRERDPPASLQVTALLIWAVAGSGMEVLCDFPQVVLLFAPLFHHLVPVCFLSWWHNFFNHM